MGVTCHLIWQIHPRPPQCYRERKREKEREREKKERERDRRKKEGCLLTGNCCLSLLICRVLADMVCQWGEKGEGTLKNHHEREWTQNSWEDITSMCLFITITVIICAEQTFPLSFVILPFYSQHRTSLYSQSGL